VAKRKKGSWIVTLRATVTKEVVCDDCTEDQAGEDPFGHAVDERELDQIDYEVTDVRPNN
jgi:hypothetical protein